MDTENEAPEGPDDKIDESTAPAETTETGMDMKEAPDQAETVLYEITPQPPGGPPLLPVVVEILEQVLPSVETPDDMLNYVSAIETLSTITVDKPLHRTMLEQIKSRTSSITDLLTVVKAVKKLERFRGIKVSCVKTGSLVFYLQCTDVGGLGELWFMYQRGELDNLLHSCLISGEALQQLHAESVSVKSTINIENYRKALVYILNSSPVRGQLMPRLSLEYPLYQPHTHTATRVLDVLQLEQQKLPEIPLPTQRDDIEDDVINKLGNLQIAARTSEETPEDTEVQEIIEPARSSVIPDQEIADDQSMGAIGDTEVPQMSELVSLDIIELERLMGPRRKRASSISSDSSGYVTGTPASGHSRPDSPTDEGDVQGTLETLLADLNTPAVQRDKVQQFDLYCQIGDLYRTKLHNLQSALQYYQNMLECSQELSEDTKQAKAYSRLGLTCDILGLTAEAFTNHEKALAILKVKAGNGTDICIASKNLASSLALLGLVSDAKTNYESALATAMETGNKTEQMYICSLLGGLYTVLLHKPQESLKHYTKMLALARDLGRKDMEGLAYNKLGLVHYEMGEYRSALEWSLKDLMMSQEDGNKDEQITAHNNVGNVYRLLGNLDQATFHFNTALQLAKQTGDQRGQMDVYFTMGDMHGKQLHSPRTAIQYYEQALGLATQLKDRRQERVAYSRLGGVHYQIGEYASALELGQKSLKIEDSSKEEQAMTHSNMGDACRLLGKLDQATFHFNTALQLAQQTGDQREQMDVYFKMGDMYGEQLHSPHTAIQYYEQALALARRLKDKKQEALAYNRLGLIQCEMGEYRSALEWSLKGLMMSQEGGNKDDQVAAHSNVGNAYRLLGKLDQATFHFNTALQLAQQTGDQRGQMDVYFRMGEMHREQLHSPHTAIQYYEQTLALARQLNDRNGEGVVYNRLGQVHSEMGECGAAMEWSQKYLQISRENGNKEEQIKALIQVGNAYSVLRKLDQATSHFNTALQLAQQTGDQRGQMDVYFQMGEMHREQLHSPHTAIQYYEQALALAKQLKDRGQEGVAYSRLGEVHYEMGEYRSALEWSLQDLMMCQEGGNKDEQITAHNNVGNVYRLLGNLDQATFHFNTALHLAQQTGDQREQMKVYFTMGDMHREQLHSPRTAIQYYEQALSLARQLKDRRQEGVAYNRLGCAHHQIGEYASALELGQKFLEIEDSSKEEQATAHSNVGDAYRSLGKLDQATSHFNTCLQLAQQTGNLQQQMDIYFRIGEMHREQLHSPHTAIQYYEQALSLARQLKDRHWEGVAYERLGMAYFEIGEYEEGLKWFKRTLQILQEDGDKSTVQGKNTTMWIYHQW
ncbi:uncharacterized protein LOC144906350 [Branchiostoma floridae x Branchiostoma belcheri]